MDDSAMTRPSSSESEAASFLPVDSTEEIEDDLEIVNFQDYLSLNVNRYDFSQVIFMQMKEVYRPGENLECSYKVTNALFPHPKDKLCLFRLGWICPQDCKTYLWAVAPRDYEAGTVFDKTVVFSCKVSYRILVIHYIDSLDAFQLLLCHKRALKIITSSVI